MDFGWDEAKRQANLQKHGIDFVDAQTIFNAYTVTLEDCRFDYGEQRYVTFGILKGHVIAVVHTETKNKIRIISARKASKNEEKKYFSEIQIGLEAT